MWLKSHTPQVAILLYYNTAHISIHTRKALYHGLKYVHVGVNGAKPEAIIIVMHTCTPALKLNTQHMLYIDCCRHACDMQANIAVHGQNCNYVHIFCYFHDLSDANCFSNVWTVKNLHYEAKVFVCESASCEFLPKIPKSILKCHPRINLPFLSLYIHM